MSLDRIVLDFKTGGNSAHIRIIILPKTNMAEITNITEEPFAPINISIEQLHEISMRLMVEGY